MVSARCAKMPTAATQGLTEPMTRASEVAGTCLTCSKNKLEVPERTTVLLCSSLVCLFSFVGARLCPAGLGVWNVLGKVEGPLPHPQMWDSLLWSQPPKMIRFTSRSELTSWISPCCAVITWARYVAMLCLSFLICDMGDGNHKNALLGCLEGEVWSQGWSVSSRLQQESLLSLLAVGGTQFQGGEIHPYTPPAPTYWMTLDRTIPLSDHFQAILWKWGC